METERMPLYQYIVENEVERYYYYFSYVIDPKEVVALFKTSSLKEIEIFDMFPEPKVQKGRTLEPLRVITKLGKEMYLPTNFNIEIIGQYRILFQYVEDDTDSNPS